MKTTWVSIRVVVSLQRQGSGLGHLAGGHRSALCDPRTFSLLLSAWQVFMRDSSGARRDPRCTGCWTWP